MIVCTTKMSAKKRKTLKCPSCTRGRICDAPAACQSRATDADIDDVDSIILKCPKCGLSVAVTIE